MCEDLAKRRKEKRAAQLVEDFDRDIKSLPGICRRMERAFFETGKERTVKSSLQSAARVLEDLLRCADELSWLAEDNPPEKYPNQISCLTESYRITGSREAGFEILMPPLQKRGDTARPHPQKVTAESVRAAALSYLEGQGLRRCLFDKCTLTYTVMIGPETGGNIGDAENLDTKQITDALTGIFYPDDNLTHVRIAVEGKMTQAPSYTRLRIEAWNE